MNYTESLKQAGLAGLVAGVATQMIYGSQGSVAVAGFPMPASVAVGVAAGAGSVAADVAHTYVPGTPIGSIGADGIELLVAGAATAYALDYVGINNGPTLSGAAIGVGSLLGGRFVDQWISGSSPSFASLL